MIDLMTILYDNESVFGHVPRPAALARAFYCEEIQTWHA